jgi:rubredoxin
VSTPPDEPCIIYTDKVEWTLDFVCQSCGWPWTIYFISESHEVEIHKTINCPMCGASHTIDFYHE